MPYTIPIAVRSLVEHVFRSGSIDAGFRMASTMAEGTRIHQKIQQEYGEQDEKESYVSMEIPYGDLLFVLDGRCDGLLKSDQGYTVDEIKSTSMDIAAITEDMFAVHWAQAKCYAYIIAFQKGLRAIRIQLTYVQVDTEKKKQFLQESTIEELELYVFDILKNYAPYALMLQQHEQVRDASIKELAFPFEAYRVGQRKLAGAVYKTIDEGRNLFAKAPTGTGKTISTTFPSVKAIGEGKLHRLFYLTAKTITRTAVEKAFSLMQSGGLHLHAVTLTAKDKICLKEEVRCQKDYCEFANGYYDRINEAILDVLTHETLMNREVIEAYARKHTVCPFEFSLDVAYAVDVVICDYNYIFDPRVSLKRLFAEQKKQTALLVDEAHNLVDRAREMFSASLNKSDFLAVQREFKGTHTDMYQAAKAVNQYFIQLRKQTDDLQLVMKELPNELIRVVELFIIEAEKVLSASGKTAANQQLLDTYFASQGLIRVSKMYDERYVTYVDMNRVRFGSSCSAWILPTGCSKWARDTDRTFTSPQHYPQPAIIWICWAQMRMITPWLFRLLSRRNS